MLSSTARVCVCVCALVRHVLFLTPSAHDGSDDDDNGRGRGQIILKFKALAFDVSFSFFSPFNQTLIPNSFFFFFTFRSLFSVCLNIHLPVSDNTTLCSLIFFSLLLQKKIVSLSYILLQNQIVIYPSFVRSFIFVEAGLCT